MIHTPFLCYLHVFQVNITCGSCLNGQCKGMTTYLWDIGLLEMCTVPQPWFLLLLIAFSFVYSHCGLFRSTIYWNVLDKKYLKLEGKTFEGAYDKSLDDVKQNSPWFCSLIVLVPHWNGFCHFKYCFKLAYHICFLVFFYLQVVLDAYVRSRMNQTAGLLYFYPVLSCHF